MVEPHPMSAKSKNICRSLSLSLKCANICRNLIDLDTEENEYLKNLFSPVDQTYIHTSFEHPTGSFYKSDLKENKGKINPFDQLYIGHGQPI